MARIYEVAFSSVFFRFGDEWQFFVLTVEFVVLASSASQPRTFFLEQKLNGSEPRSRGYAWLFLDVLINDNVSSSPQNSSLFASSVSQPRNISPEQNLKNLQLGSRVFKWYFLDLLINDIFSFSPQNSSFFASSGSQSRFFFLRAVASSANQTRNCSMYYELIGSDPQSRAFECFFSRFADN